MAVTVLEADPQVQLMVVPKRKQGAATLPVAQVLMEFEVAAYEDQAVARRAAGVM